MGSFGVYQEVGSIKDPNKLTSCQHRDRNFAERPLADNIGLYMINQFKGKIRTVL